MLTPTRRDRWFKFWAQDELGYVPLATCSLEAQGLFARLRAHLHINSEPYGYLEDLTSEDYVEELAFALRVAADKLLVVIEELKKRKVLVAAPNGCLYSPHMVEREQTRLEYAEKGRSGGLKRAAQASATAPAEAPAQAGSQADDGNAWPPAQAPAQGSRARPRSSSSSSSSSSEGVQGEAGSEDGLPPHIPTFEEFCAHFAPDCIPGAWLRKQWEWFEDNHGWLTRGGELKDFRRPVRRRWVADKATYRIDSALGEKTATDKDALIAEIEAKLRIEKNPTERAKLLKQLKELTS
jgi:hypothetical protein